MKRAKNLSEKCWPATRSKLLKKSVIAHLHGDKMKSIFYETKALCIGYMTNNIDISDGKKKIINHDAFGDLISVEVKKENALLDFVTAKISDVKLVECDENESPEEFSEHEVAAGIKEMLEKCSKLPKEWNVLQVTKMTGDYSAFASKKESASKTAPIKFTLFGYDQLHRVDNEPFTFYLSFENDNTVFSTAFELYQEIFKEYGNNSAADTYQQYIKKLLTELSKLIEEMKLWLGPWVTLFSGKIKNHNGGVAFEKKICEQVDAFCDEQKTLAVDQIILLNIVARRLDLLTSENIKQAASDIAKTKEEFKDIMKFLAKLKTTSFRTKYDYYPCILILDELLDTFPWEMVIPCQEITRFSSLYLLFDLYDKYKDDISDGYLRMHVKTGNVLINPNDDPKLDSMTKRMTDFFNYWTPHWKRLERKPPTDNEITDLLTTAETYVYCGHGSSFQYMNHPEIEQCSTKSVMFLFGCESAALKLRGLVSEAAAIHLTLHAIKCPAIFGSISIISDIWADMVAIRVLTQWIPSEQKKAWSAVHVTEEVKNRVKNILDNIDGKRQPSLLANAVEIRCEHNFALRMRAAMICRGLPVYNLSVEE